MVSAEPASKTCIVAKIVEATAVPINKPILTLPTGTPTFVAPFLSPPDAKIQFPYLVLVNTHVDKIAKKINQTTEGGIPVAKGVPSVLKSIKFIEPSQTKNHLNVSVANNQAMGSFSIKTLKPGTCVRPVINLVRAKVAPLKINNIAKVTMKDGSPVLTTNSPLKYPTISSDRKSKNNTHP